MGDSPVLPQGASQTSRRPSAVRPWRTSLAGEDPNLGRSGLLRGTRGPEVLVCLERSRKALELCFLKNMFFCRNLAVAANQSEPAAYCYETHH